MTKEQAIAELIERGATNEKKEDQHGETKTGWWMDTVFLAKNPIDALAALKG